MLAIQIPINMNKQPSYYFTPVFGNVHRADKHLHQHSETYPFFLLLKPILLTSSFKFHYPAKGFFVPGVNLPWHVSRLSMPGYRRVVPVSILVFFHRLAAINGWGACTPAVLVYPNHFKPLLKTTTTCGPSTTKQHR
jgi:hypothetical protein